METCDGDRQLTGVAHDIAPGRLWYRGCAWKLATRMGDEPASEGPVTKEYITLVSAEGHEFQVEKQAAMVSNTIKSMLTGGGARALLAGRMVYTWWMGAAAAAAVGVLWLLRLLWLRFMRLSCD